MKHSLGLPLTVALVSLFVGLAAPAHAQNAPPRPGICDGIVCGPAGEFSPASFPTLTPIHWDAFPRNTPRIDYVPQSGRRTFTVAVDGSDDADGTAEHPLATLNHALELAQPGDVIWVGDGQYTLETPDENAGLILDTPGVTLAAQHIGGAVLVPASPGIEVGIQALADDLIVDGFVIRGFPAVGIEFGNTRTPQRNLLLKHLRVESTEEGIRAAYGGNGSQPVIEGMRLFDVWLRDIALIGLQCGEGPCNHLRWEALRIDMRPDPGSDSGADAIALESGENVLVFNTEIRGASGDGIDLKTASGVVANVIVQNTGRNGIKIWYGGDIINALVAYTGADAAIVFEAGHFRILNTLVARHAWGDSAYAMTAAYDTASEPGSLTIANSLFYENAGAVWVSPNLALDVRHSIFTGSANGEELVWEPLIIGVDGSPISALEAARAGTGNLSGIDPRFTAPDAGDFSWGPDSPLLDAGTDTVPLPDFDLFGNPRVVGDAVDIGPVEWEPPVTTP